MGTNCRQHLLSSSTLDLALGGEKCLFGVDVALGTNSSSYLGGCGSGTGDTGEPGGEAMSVPSRPFSPSALFWSYFLFFCIILVFCFLFFCVVLVFCFLFFLRSIICSNCVLEILGFYLIFIHDFNFDLFLCFRFMFRFSLRFSAVCHTAKFVFVLLAWVRGR